MLRITLDETGDELTIRLEGRIAGPWVQELRRVWAEVAAHTQTRLLSLDLCSVTYADQDGKRALREINSQAGAKLIADTPWTRYLAEEVADHNSNCLQEGPESC
jgi:anti-anti-sigma regulatory factor